jgi:hypothetical protein
MTVISGQAQLSDLSSTQRAIALDKDILLLEPENAPLTVFTKSIENGGNVRSTIDPEFKWVEDERDVRWDAVNNGGGYTSSEETIVVDTQEVFYANALIRVPRTSEIMFVTELVESTKIKCKRGYAGTTKAALVDNDPLFVVGVVAEDGQTSLTARRKAPTTISNLTEITRTSVEESGTAMSSGNNTTPHAWVHQHRKANTEHLLSLEFKGLFGSKASQTGPGGKALRTTAGALSFLTSNNQDMGGTMTEAELGSWIRSITRYGGSNKVVFCSALALDVINNYALGRLQGIQSDQDKVAGIAISKYITAQGELKLVKHNLLEGAVWGGYMIAVDFGKAAPQYRYLGDGSAPGGSRDTKLLKNRQANDADGQKDEILTECGFQFPQPKTGGVATGITG